MKASNTLTKPFLVGVLSDICDLFPEHDFSYDIDTLNGFFVNFAEDVVIIEMSKVGKALERALITGQEFNCPSNLFPRRDGQAYPIFLDYVWEIVFTPSGLPCFKLQDYTDTLIETFVGNRFDDDGVLAELAWSKKPGELDYERDQQALAVLVLRQLFLGLSKLSSLECLYLGTNRNRGL